MHGTYVGNGRLLIDTTFGAKLLVSADDLSLMPDLVVHGLYDAPFTNYLRRTLEGGAVAFDVGANVGLFTMLMAWQVGASGQVVSYECEPRNLALLRENVALNYATWVDVRNQAVGAAAGTAQFFRTTRFQGNSSLVAHDDEYVSRFRGIDEQEVLDVEVVALDEHVGRFPRIDLVKVDVEGAEGRVLQGMRALLDSGTVQRLCVEIVRERAPAEWPQLAGDLRRLHDQGWSFATLEHDGTSTALTLDTLLDRAAFSQVLIERPGATA